MYKVLRDFRSIVVFCFVWQTTIVPMQAEDLGTEDIQATRAEEVLWSFVGDSKTLMFRDVTVLVVEDALRKVALIRNVGGAITYIHGKAYRISRYEIGARAYEMGVFRIDLLLKAKDDEFCNPEKLLVVNARLYFISKAGGVYENYLAPRGWPAERSAPKKQ